MGIDLWYEKRHQKLKAKRERNFYFKLFGQNNHLSMVIKVENKAIGQPNLFWLSIILQVGQLTFFPKIPGTALFGKKKNQEKSFMGSSQIS